MKNITIFCLLILSLYPVQSYCQYYSQQEQEILELQDKRILGSDDMLINYLHSLDSNIRIAAINALANIGDTSTVTKLEFLLAGPFKDYPKSSEVKAAAFMLGKIPCAESVEMLDVMLKTESGKPQQIATLLPDLINSFGKTGGEANMNYIISLCSSEDFSIDEINRALAMSIARFALRKIKNQNSVNALKRLVNTSSDTIVRRNAAYAFWRTGDKNLLLPAKQEIYTLAESDDAQTRMWAFNALGKLQDQLLLMFTLESIKSEQDWRVKINMLNSFANYNIDSIPEVGARLFDSISDEIENDNEHVSLTAIAVLGKLYAGKSNANNFPATNVKSRLNNALNSENNLSWRQKSEIANTLISIYGDEAKEILLNAFARTNDFNLKAGIVKAFGNFNDAKIFKEIRDTISKEVQRYNLANPNTSGALIGSNDLAKLYRAFVEMLSNLDDKAIDEDRNIIRLIYTEFSGSKDPVLADICLSSLTDSMYLKYRNETVMVLALDYKELESPKDDDVKLIFIDAFGKLGDSGFIIFLESELNNVNYDIAKNSAAALEKITGKKYNFTATLHSDYDWEYLNKLSQNKFITVKTNRGSIRIELLPDVAPFTVMNFLKLAQRNFFDSTLFHRVVSNFVIQGGDPGSTGYGGPGYSIRSEFSQLNYETGMVGMASSGKDTEGSQFFITHSATPHLDGNYTIFGKVIDGMEIVDLIMIGDYIESIEQN